MNVTIKKYTKENINDVIEFELWLRKEESFWGWEIDDNYIKSIENSFDDEKFSNSISLLAYHNDCVVGRLDTCLISSRLDGSIKAYLDWICVVKSYRHQGVAQKLLSHLKSELKSKGIDTLIAIVASNEEALSFYRNIPNSEIRDSGIWIEI